MSALNSFIIMIFFVKCTNSNQKENQSSERKKYSPDFFVQLSGKKYSSCHNKNFRFKKTRIYIFNIENQGELRSELDSMLNSRNLLAKDSLDYESVAVVYYSRIYNSLYHKKIGTPDSKIIFLNTKTWCNQWDTTLQSVNLMDDKLYYYKIINAVISRKS